MYEARNVSVKEW